MELLKRFWSEDSAVSAVEYAIMLAFLALLVAGAMTAFFTNIQGVFQDWAGWFKNAPKPEPISSS
jgi:Flp pilus assembly pilin Flp